MKRNWVVMVMAAALTAAPAAAQTSQTQPPATAQPTQPQGSTTPKANSADEHLRAASAALNDVPVANLSARAKTQVNELKRRLTALERAGTAATNASATGQANRNPKAAASGVNWGTEVAAMDKVLTSLLGSESAATGTAATTTSPTGTAGTRGKAATAVTLDDTSRAKLTEVRTHLTAYAAAMGGGGSQAPAPATAPDPAATAASSTTPPAATTPPATATPPTAQPPVPTAPPAGTQPPAATPAAQPDMTEAKRHLTEARNTLSALTQLPAAAQLAGEGRTQVSQLITNFNELITTQSNWRESYAKVNANMTALLGADTAAVAAATGTAGAVGTSGSSGVTLDPTIREKLIEMRKHLAEFEKIAGGGTTNTPAANVEDPPTSAPNTPPATSGTPGATGTSGTTTPATAAADQQRPGQADWMKHMAAIEVMLKSQDESGGLTLDKAKVEMLRTHLAEIKKFLGGK